MKIELESKKVYVSDDGKEKSYRMEDILKYEKRQLKEIFEKISKFNNFLKASTFLVVKSLSVKSGPLFGRMSF